MPLNKKCLKMHLRAYMNKSKIERSKNMDFETLLKKISFIEDEIKTIKDELIKLIKRERGNKNNENKKQS